MIRILGDINFADWYFDKGQGVGTAIARGEEPFKHLGITDDDFWIGNFECVCAEGIDKPFVISPNLLDKIQHLNLYGVANNHSMQVGDKGYNQTLDFLDKKNIPYVGSRNRKSNIFYHQGKSIGIIAFCMRPDNFTSSPLYWHIPELKDIESELQQITDCDYKICFVHWGYEYNNHPNIEQIQLAHWLVDIGFNLIAGMHPHVAQGAEEYNGGHIFYSLGNSVFNMEWEPTRYGLLVNVDLSGDNPRVYREYTKIGEDLFPKIVDAVPEQFSSNYLDSRVHNILENEKYFAETLSLYTQYAKANRKAILKRLLKMPMRAKYDLLSDFVKRRFLHK